MTIVLRLKLTMRRIIEDTVGNSNAGLLLLSFRIIRFEEAPVLVLTGRSPCLLGRVIDNDDGRCSCILVFLTQREDYRA